MISIDGIYEDVNIINKSKFYAFVYPIASEQEAKNYLLDVRQKYADATHVCSAYTLTSPRLEKCDDDGEPSGTAGKPLLELIKKRGFDNILLVVVRYFGGIKLGAGGLVRAYTNSGNLVLDKAQIVNMLVVDKYRAEIDLAVGAKLIDCIRLCGCEIQSCKYTDKVEIEFVGEISKKLQSIFPNVKLEKIGSITICQK